MRGIILQHWDGPLSEVEIASSHNIKRYAESIGGSYQMVLGKPFSERLNAPCQKLIMLASSWDAFDVVVMLDADMFAPKGMTENVFDLTGVGYHQSTARARIRRKLPDLIVDDVPFWGGAIYRLERGLRERLRSTGTTVDDMLEFNARGTGEDEGIMHLLATRAGVTEEGAYLDYRWCQGSFEAHPERAGFIHMRSTVRDRPKFPGNGRDKLANMRQMMADGVIE